MFVCMFIYVSILLKVMMLEIVQHVQEFLHKHDLPPVSLHEEMVRTFEDYTR